MRHSSSPALNPRFATRKTKSKLRRPVSLPLAAAMTVRLLKASHGLHLCSPKFILLALVIITTVTVTCMEVARLRPHFHPGRVGLADRTQLLVFGGAAKQGKVGTGQKVPGGARETMSWGRTMGPRGGGEKKHPPIREIENAGLDDFWAAGFGDAETELEGGDDLVVSDAGKFAQKGGVSGQLPEGGGEQDQWERLVSTPAVETIEGRDVIWQVPPGEPTRVILLAQGRNEQADSWWLQSSTCPECSGSPPAVGITEAALRHGYVVVTIDNGRWSREIPYNDKELTWDNRWPLYKNADVSVVAAVLEEWRAREGLSALPLVCLGFSGGARLCSMLSHAAPVAAQALYMHPGNGKAITSHPRADGTPYPPSLFVHMPRHHELNSLLKHSMESLTSRDVTVGLLEVYPTRVTTEWLSEHMGRHLTAADIEKLHNALKAQGWLDEDEFMNCPNALLRKPGYEKLFKGAELEVTWEAANHLQRVLRQAYALHEVSSDRVSEVLDWLGDVCRLPDGMRTGERCTELVNEIPVNAHRLVYKHEPPC
ncbi:hypothetical protein KFL_004250020 [Klebsormidium nitens]|uniref:Uncharacterized protein n=1 Tax=Klebsormidium nitens TaxID=105231 RepID=A0A1Y1IEK6_KLENI|nr:hypothetical protein KFL_004250020 [Klebsormidium nitens]|eukprot:GAQ88402.1 hypothetical protein KFL_004250020 [Klebsormidium nitens]